MAVAANRIERMTMVFGDGLILYADVGNIISVSGSVERGGYIDVTVIMRFEEGAWSSAGGVVSDGELPVGYSSLGSGLEE